ncbi:hypothetical protein JF66_17240 [Cryobacterium sp. MLB-32]|nr:hypothetical protein JF66_17240 [Cryobacterium sp. MLB-32]
MPAPIETVEPEAAATSAFEDQLPLTGQFVAQWADTAGSVEITRHRDGTVWATLADFSTGASPNLRLYLNEGKLVKNGDGAWATDSGTNYEIAPVQASGSSQEIQIPGSQYMTEIRSVTILDYTSPDFMNFGSAPLT